MTSPRFLYQLRFVSTRARRAAVCWLGAALLAGCHAIPGEPDGDALIPAEEDDAVDSSLPVMPAEPWDLVVPTYEASGEVIHPDVFVAPKTWRGTRFWYAATPYPSGNPLYENPSIFTGNRSRDWQPPAGLQNPVARQEAGGYLSDPDILRDPARDELRLYYRQTIGEIDQLFLKTSADGVIWSAPVQVLQGLRFDLISPAVVRETDGSWRMWTVGARDGGCRARSSNVVLSARRSPDGISWEQPEEVALTIPGRVPWHWDVQYVQPKAEYWALVAAYPDGKACSESGVFFARSADGLSWRVSPTPLLDRGALESMRDMVYRSTFRYFPRIDLVVVWFSGARLERGAYHYKLATARYHLPDLLQRVQRSRAANPSPMEGTGDIRRSPADSAARAAFISHFP